MRKSKDTKRVKHKKWRKELPEMAGAFLPHNLWRELPQFIKAIFVVCILALAVLASFVALGIIVTDRALSIEMVMIAILIAVAAVVCGVVAIFYAVWRVSSMGMSIARLSSQNERLIIALRKVGGLEFLEGFEPDLVPHDDGLEFAFLNQDVSQEGDDNDFDEVGAPEAGVMPEVAQAPEAGVMPEVAVANEPEPVAAVTQEPKQVVPETAQVEAAKAEEQGAERQVEAPLQPALEEQPIVAEEPADGTKEYEIRHSHPLPKGVTQLVPQGITQELPGKGAIDTAMSIQPESNRVEQQAGNQPEEQFKLEASSVRAQANELGVMFNALYAKLIKCQVSHYSQLPSSELFALRKNGRIAG